MLTAKADRVAVYDAHKSAGAEGIYFSVFIHYQEDGVSYPNGIAAWNDFTGNGFAQMAELACECVENRIAPLIHLGGDEKGSQWVKDNIAAIVLALKTSRLGDLTQGYCALVPTFDSNSDGDWSDPGDQWSSVNVAIRQAIPDATALYTWLPTGWARLGTININAQQVIDGESAVDRWCQELPGTTICQFLAPYPAILPGSQWDAEHQLYQPTWASDPSGWLQYVQMMARRVNYSHWEPPADEPFDVSGGLGLGGPLNGQPVLVSADARHPQTYTMPSSRGQTFYSGEEIGTFLWTHGFAITTAQLDTIRRGLLACGCDCTG
jgi:hypothetical protein